MPIDLYNTSSDFNDPLPGLLKIKGTTRTGSQHDVTPFQINRQECKIVCLDHNSILYDIHYTDMSIKTIKYCCVVLGYNFPHCSETPSGFYIRLDPNFIEQGKLLFYNITPSSTQLLSIYPEIINTYQINFPEQSRLIQPDIDDIFFLYHSNIYFNRNREFMPHRSTENFPGEDAVSIADTLSEYDLMLLSIGYDREMTWGDTRFYTWPDNVSVNVNLNVNHDADFQSPVKVTLTEYEFNRICGTKKTDYKYIFRKMGPKLRKEFNITDTTCSICQDEIRQFQSVGITPCGHIFHKNCIKTWLTKMCTHPTCPACRKDVRT